jgi:hypothetical protein
MPLLLANGSERLSSSRAETKGQEVGGNASCLKNENKTESVVGAALTENG